VARPLAAELLGDDLEQAFNQAMVRILVRARDEVNFKAVPLLRMVTEIGGLRTARHLIRNPISDAFTNLWERGRLDLTAEALALQPEFRSLFAEDELNVARRRVGEATPHHPRD